MLRRGLFASWNLKWICPLTFSHFLCFLHLCLILLSGASWCAAAGTAYRGAKFLSYWLVSRGGRPYLFLGFPVGTHNRVFRILFGLFVVLTHSGRLSISNCFVSLLFHILTQGREFFLLPDRKLICSRLELSWVFHTRSGSASGALQILRLLSPRIRRNPRIWL
jgi:hypothetical protein